MNAVSILRGEQKRLQKGRVRRKVTTLADRAGWGGANSKVQII